MENHGLAIQNVFTVDWVTVSFSQSDVYSVISILGLKTYDFQYNEKHMWGYTHTAQFGHVRIFYTPYSQLDIKANKGCCLNMSGQACREFETYSNSFSWADLFSRFELLGGEFTRLDLAYDDRTGVIFLPRLAMDVADRNFIGHARKSERLYSDDLDKDIQGLSVYIGSKQSDIFIRIYDKAAERGYHPSEMHWVRVEIQMRKIRAVMAARAVATEAHIGEVFAGILNNYFRIVTPTGDSNKSRWPVAEYWEKIIRDVEKLHLTMPGIEYNFRRSQAHFLKQYHQMLFAYMQMHGDQAAAKLFADVVALCQGEELKEKYVAAVREYHAIYGNPENVVSSDDIQQVLNSHVEVVNKGLVDDNKRLRSLVDLLRQQLAESGHVTYEQTDFEELYGRDPNLPF